MAKKRKRRKVLPEVTVLAYSQKSLIAFVSAAETLAHVAIELRTCVEELKAKTQRRGKEKPDPEREQMIALLNAIRDHFEEDRQYDNPLLARINQLMPRGSAT